MDGFVRARIMQASESETSFHLISDGHGDVKANRCEIDVVPIARNNDLSFRFQARWISGKPTLVVNTWDRSFGGVIHLPIPKNLGTPGAANSGATEIPAPDGDRTSSQPCCANFIRRCDYYCAGRLGDAVDFSKGSSSPGQHRRRQCLGNDGHGRQREQR